MNFEFLKDLCGLGSVYENCSNAEKLAVTMPAQSMFTSRKSAELLAKFIYLAAHGQGMEDLSFVDILRDQAVLRYINNRDVIDAFHYIRKSGNRAAHADDQESPEDAISVLQDLHYVAGETARKLGLIKDYPYFEDQIAAFPGPVVMTEEDVNQKAREMFAAYIEEYEAQLERDSYIEEGDYGDEYMLLGNVEMHEYLEFKNKPRNIELTEYLQEYLDTLVRLSIERFPLKAEESETYDPFTLEVTIIIGGKEYSTNNMDSFMTAIHEELPKANGFTIDCVCDGILREFFHEEPDENGNFRKNMIRKDGAWTGSGLLDKLESFKRRELFTYYNIIYYPDAGKLCAAAIIDSKTKDITGLFSKDIAAHQPALLFNNDGLSIYVNGTKGLNDYPELFEELKAIVRDNIFETSLHYCEDVWNPDSEEYIEDCLMPHIPIKARTISEYEAFLEKLNCCLGPWKDELGFIADEPDFENALSGDSSNILYSISDLSLAVIEVRDGSLHLTGTVFERKNPTRGVSQ